MKLRLEIDAKIEEDEIIIRAKQLNEQVMNLQKILSQETKGEQKMVCYDGDREIYLPLDSIMFFETMGQDNMAHTADAAYKTNLRLYELCEVLPSKFLRISKSAILNIDYIFSIDRDLTASSVVTLRDSYKKVYVSRRYYKLLKDRLDEKRYFK